MVELAPDKHPAVDELSAEPGYLSHNIKMNKFDRRSKTYVN